MDWPWVSRARLEDARDEIARLRAENATAHRMNINLEIENAKLQEPASAPEAQDEDAESHGKATLRKVKAWAQNDIDSKNRLKQVKGQ